MNKRPLLTVLNSKNANMVYSSPLKLHVRTLGNSLCACSSPVSGHMYVVNSEVLLEDKHDDRILLRLQVLLFAETKDYESIKPLYMEAAQDFKSKVSSH